jgi:hypothetical protein
MIKLFQTMLIIRNFILSNSWFNLLHSQRRNCGDVTCNGRTVLAPPPCEE